MGERAEGVVAVVACSAQRIDKKTHNASSQYLPHAGAADTTSARVDRVSSIGIYKTRRDDGSRLCAGANGKDLTWPP